MKKISVPEEGARALFGVHDENLKSIEKALGVQIASRGDELFVEGDPAQVQKLENIFQQFSELVEEGYQVSAGDLRVALRLLRQDPNVSLKDFFLHAVLQPSRGKRVIPRSLHQLSYIKAIEASDIVLGIGPAGTGKTYLAVAMAVAALHQKKVNRIILARPAVEAGEKLGFLPGDLQEKIDPYLRPLYDALYDMMETEKVAQLIERGTIEIAPIAFMRGRTLNDSFVIMDEAQNTTSEQMKMFLTRIGFGSKAVVTGDITQIDLPPGKMSGLVEAIDLLSDVNGIEFVYFDETDVVRHPLVQSIIRAYDRARERKAAAAEAPSKDPAELMSQRARQRGPEGPSSPSEERGERAEQSPQPERTASDPPSRSLGGSAEAKKAEAEASPAARSAGGGAPAQ